MRTIVLEENRQSFLLGSCLIALCSLIWIPFYPVSFTMQTFAIFLIALRFSPKQSVLSVLGYLLFHTFANPLWMVGNCAGYLIAFPFAAFLTSYLVRKGSPIIALFAGQIIIYLFGFFGLMLFIGPYEAFMKGIVLFLGTDLMKNIAAIHIHRKL